MSGRAFKKLDSLIMAITENACGNGSSEDAAEKREALESHIHGMQSRLESLEKDVEKEIKERDYRDDVIDKLLDMVLGEGRAEWSSNYDFDDALNEAEGATFCIREMTAIRDACELINGGCQQDSSAILFFKDRKDSARWLRTIDRLTNKALQSQGATE